MLFTTTINNHQTKELLEDCNLEELPNVKEEDFLDYLWTVFNQVRSINKGKLIEWVELDDGSICFNSN